MDLLVVLVHLLEASRVSHLDPRSGCEHKIIRYARTKSSHMMTHGTETNVTSLLYNRSHIQNN
jgi:hypothetical protein